MGAKHDLLFPNSICCSHVISLIFEVYAWDVAMDLGTKWAQSASQFIVSFCSLYRSRTSITCTHMRIASMAGRLRCVGGACTQSLIYSLSQRLALGHACYE